MIQLILQYDFVQNAFLAGTIVAIVTAVVGYFVVLRSQAFAGHALSHIGFAGATGAAILGISSLLGTFAFTILAALGMGALGERVRGRVAILSRERIPGGEVVVQFFRRDARVQEEVTEGVRLNVVAVLRELLRE